MFKCVECGAEYKIKPDYCDCGNDMFELIDDLPETGLPQTPSITKQPIPQQQFADSFSTKQQSSFDTVSVAIFSLCVFLAFITVFFIGNTKEHTATQQNTPTQTTSQNIQNIPSVESFWDNSTEGIKPDNLISQNTNEIKVKPDKQSETQQQTKQQEPVDPFTAKFEKWLNQPSRFEQEPVKTVTPQPVKQVSQPTKTVQTAKTTPAKTMTNTITAQTQQAKKQTQANNSQKDLISRIQKQYSTTTTPAKTTQVANSNPIKTPTQTQPPAQAGNSTPNTSINKTNTNTTTAKTTTTVQPQTTVTQAAPKVQQGKSAAELKQELTTYKASLRNNIGKKINFANIVGDGSCAITFTINSSGKLTNRKFSQQSTNITLNDAVYNAMMSTPSYNPPPEGYRNETLTFYVKIYNGNYEISLK